MEENNIKFLSIALKDICLVTLKAIMKLCPHGILTNRICKYMYLLAGLKNLSQKYFPFRIGKNG